MLKEKRNLKLQEKENIGKDKKVTLDDDGIIEVIAKQTKQRKNALPEYEKSGKRLFKIPERDLYRYW